jgi:hypothetical protein
VPTRYALPSAAIAVALEARKYVEYTITPDGSSFARNAPPRELRSDATSGRTTGKSTADVHPATSASPFRSTAIAWISIPQSLYSPPNRAA